MPERAVEAMVREKSVAHCASSRSSSWKWMAPYPYVTLVQSGSEPSLLYPFTPRVGVLTRTPFRPSPETSMMISLEIPREKSYFARTRPVDFSV